VSKTVERLLELLSSTKSMVKLNGMVENRDGLSGKGINTRGKENLGKGLLIHVVECDLRFAAQLELRIPLLILWPIKPSQLRGKRTKP
jgi:hypothetical protein